MQEQASTCPQCGAEIGQPALAGLCPKCLMRNGLESTADAAKWSAVDPSGTEMRAVDEVPGRYTLITEHARGGMGRVLVVHDESLGRDVALKELLPGDEDGATPTAARHSKDLVARFLREAKITGQLEHPGITPVHELGRRPDGTPYYTMKLVDGRTLAAAIRDAKTYEARRRLLPHFVALCQTISYSHSRGVIHRDLKPENVLVGDFGETVVVDWGLAKLIEGRSGAAGPIDPDAETLYRPDAGRSADATRHGDLMGTPAYMSPEQARGRIDEIDERSDVYSLGAVLYQILTGEPPYKGKSAAEIVDRVLDGPPRPVRQVESRVSRELAMACETAMARDRGQRTPSAGQLALQVAQAIASPDLYANPFRPFLSDLVPELRRLTRLEKAELVREASRRWRRRNFWPSILHDATVVAALLGFAALALVAFFALIALAREIGLRGWDEVIWAIITSGFVVPVVLTSRTHNRSIAPYVRDLLLERKSGSSPRPQGLRSLVAQRISAWGLAGAMAGSYVTILLMDSVDSSPSLVPIDMTFSYYPPLVGLVIGALLEAVLLTRSQRKGGAESRVST